jgi:SAM-dependent methyltransferase
MASRRIQTNAASAAGPALTILNIGCGTKTSDDPRVVNIDWSMYLVIKSNPILFRMSRLLLSAERFQRLQSLPDSIVVHDLRHGIPYPDNSVDVVYDSHFLEHLDPPVARSFLLEVKRVLKPGGLQRIVVPDLERLCCKYLTHLQACRNSASEARTHDDYIAAVIEQMVRREAYGAAQQTPLRRKLERLIVGDARKRGETHQWMYDAVNLPHLLLELGYRDVRTERYDTSRVPDWNEFGLDRNDEGGEYKPESLYVEAVK